MDIRRVNINKRGEKMGYPTKIQLIARKDKNSNQWYVNFPNAIAQAMDFEKGETVEWTIESLSTLRMERQKELKKKK